MPLHCNDVVKEVMTEYGRLTHSRMLAYLPDKEPRKHLYDLTSDYPIRGGHGLRPAICIANAKAFGAPESMSILSAVSIEILHNALLVHDDIQDESLLRRGEPTMHELHGVPMAINVGDTLLLMSMPPLMDNLKMLSPLASQLLMEDRQKTAYETAEGQALELGWRRDNDFDLTEQDYLIMVTKKTSWLTMIHPLRVGAIIGSGGMVDLNPLYRLGYFLGAAFQIRDDLLNLIGDLESYGKEINGDLMEGKRTLMLLHLFRHVTQEQKKDIIELMGRSRQDRTEDVSWIRSLMDLHGSIEHAQAVADRLSAEAKKEFDSIYRSTRHSRDLEFIAGLCDWVIQRH